MSANHKFDLHSDEHVLGIIRASAWAYLPRLFFGVLWVLVPFFLLFPLLVLGSFGVIFFLVLLGSGVFYLFKRWVRWQYTMLIVTDQRVIDIEQKSILSRELTDLRWRDVRRIRVRKGRGWQKLFRLGAIQIKGKKRAGYNLELLGIKRVELVESFLNEVKSREV